MNEAEAWARLASTPVAVLGTINSDGTPHLVPFTFAAVSRRSLISAVDSKSKTTRKLVRLSNIERDPRVSVLAHHYEPDWSRLWWVKATGTAEIRQQVSREMRETLTARYERYAGHSLGPFVVINVSDITGWGATA